MSCLDLLSSRYPAELIGDPAQADCIIVNSFGTEKHPRSVNWHLAKYAISVADGRPVIADSGVSDLLNEEVDLAVEIQGSASTALGSEIDTWKIQVAAGRYMDAHDLDVALQVSHHLHMGRTCAQASRAGVPSSIAPPAEEMPSHFDSTSKQLWTRSRSLWMIREAIGIPLLKIRRKI